MKGKFKDLSGVMNSNKPYWKSEWYLKYGLDYWNDKVNQINERKGGNYWLNKK